MRVLLDEQLPVGLAAELTGHAVDTVVGLGWQGVSNGKLLRRAAGRYDALVTMDRGMPHQQNLAGAPLGVVLIRARSNRMVHLRPLVRDVLDALGAITPGELRTVGA